MKQLSGYLFVGLLAGLWMSLRVVRCQNTTTGIYRPSIPYCYNTSSVKTCFTILLANNSHPARKTFKKSSQWCKVSVPGSSLIVINGTESQRTVEGFIGTQVLANETIFTDARKLSASESQNWSWVNGQPYFPEVPRDSRSTVEQSLDGGCVESKHGQSLTYCFGNVTSRFGYICEYPGFSQRQNNDYTANEGLETWYDARRNCLKSGGDLASIKVFRAPEDRLQLTKDQKYWIGFRRNKWIWNSTGVALTYTNWNNGFPDETSGKQCICFSTRCSRENERANPKCEEEHDRKWRTCNCNNSYAIVCQKSYNLEENIISASADLRSSVYHSAYTKTNFPERKSYALRIEIYFTTRTYLAIETSIKTTPNGTTTSTTASTFEPVIPSVTAYATTPAQETERKTESTSSMSQTPSDHFSEHQSTAFASSSSSPELFSSFSTKEILLILLLFVAVIFIIVAVIVVIRKRKHDKRNEGSAIENIPQSEIVSSVYATAVSVNRPSEVTVPPGNTIYAEVEMTRRPTPSNNIVCASVQITNVINAEPNKPAESSAPTGKAIKALDPLNLEAIEVKPGAGSGGVATQDPSAVYAELIKLKKSF